jgi:hypothetical protein
MTNDDLRNMEIGLLQLKQHTLRPVLNMMVAYALNTLKPATSALTETQNAIRKEYLDLAPDTREQRNEDGSLKLQPGKSMDDYNKAIETLFTMEVEPSLPKFKFRVLDFMESNISFSPEITQLLGPLVSYEGFEDFVLNLQKAGLPVKGSTVHHIT